MCASAASRRRSRARGGRAVGERSVSFAEASARYELEAREAQLSFVAAALMGARDIASSSEEKDLARTINAVCLETILKRNEVRKELRRLAEEDARRPRYRHPPANRPAPEAAGRRHQRPPSAAAETAPSRAPSSPGSTSQR